MCENSGDLGARKRSEEVMKICRYHGGGLFWCIERRELVGTVVRCMMYHMRSDTRDQ